MKLSKIVDNKIVVRNSIVNVQNDDCRGIEYGEGKKILLVYNPKSGNGMFSSHLDHIIEKFQDRGYIVRPIRGAKNDILEYVFQTIHPEDYRQVIIAGGDGTINIVVNVMEKYGINLPIAIFPSGTANDFAYYFEIPHDIDGMIDIALGDNYTYADLACVNGRYYINVAAMGTLVDVSQKTDPSLKNTLGVMAYYLKGLSEAKNLKPLPIKLTTEDAVYEENMYFMLVMNGCSAGGFKHISPDSEIGDGKLNVVLFRAMKIHEIVPLFFDVIQGQHNANKNVLSFKTEYLKLESPINISTDVDGETGEAFPLEFRVLPRRLKIFTKENDI